MRPRAIPLAVLVLLALAPVAVAKEGESLATTPETNHLEPGAEQTVTMTLVHVSDRNGEPQETPIRGAQPLLTLVNIDTHRQVVAIGTPTDARGRSRMTVTTPSSGRWHPTVQAAKASFDYPTTVFGSFDTPSARPDDGRSFPWPAVAGGAGLALALVVAAALARRRRPRLGGAQ